MGSHAAVGFAFFKMHKTMFCYIVRGLDVGCDVTETWVEQHTICRESLGAAPNWKLLNIVVSISNSRAKLLRDCSSTVLVKYKPGISEIR